MNKDLKTLLSDLKALLFADKPAEQAPPADAPKGTEVKGKDGKVYSVDKLEVGGVLQIADQSGALAPVPAGEYELEDGSKLTVKDGGVIETVAAPQAHAAEPAAAEPAPKDQPADTVSKSDFEALNARVKVLEDTLTQLVSGNSNTFKAVQSMFAAVEALSEEPTAKPTDAPKGNNFSEAKTKKQVAFSALQDAVGKLNPTK